MVEYQNKETPKLWLLINNLDGLDLVRECKWRQFRIDGEIFTEYTKEFEHAIVMEKLRGK